MIECAAFEKVSYGEYKKTKYFQHYDEIKIPHRATKGSAGYDFYSPFEFTLEPGQSITIPTGIRAVISDGWALFILPRSGLGFKYRLRLDNTVGLIDSDYSESDNEGHIFIKITNESIDKSLTVSKGMAFAQGVFMQYGAVYGDSSEAARNGGFGSTD